MNVTTNYREYLVLMCDGSSVPITLPGNWKGRAGRAPLWLLERLGITHYAGEKWSLYPEPFLANKKNTRDKKTQPQAAPKLYLVRAATVAANRAPFDPRQARLRTEKLRLEKINKESDYVRVEPINVLPGSEPEQYRVTFLCRGIEGIDPSTRMPIYRDRHEVEIICDDEFPADVPRLRWVTPIWHPNVQHVEPKGVCVNKAEWLGGMRLEHLCRLMFEMVQYKNYHAARSKPFPLDQEVARWVLEFAEPHNIVNKAAGKFVDDKPFTRPTVMEHISVSPETAAPTAEPAVPKIKIVNSTVSAPSPPPSSRIKVVNPLLPARPAGGTRTSRIKVIKE